MDKRLASKILSNLDNTADQIKAVSRSGKIDPRLAAQLIAKIDEFSDKFEVVAFGKESFMKRREHVARVIQMDRDEPYMRTFDNPNKVIQADKDEPYMHTSGAGFNSKDIGTFDVDQTATVSDRDEYQVRDLNQWAGGTKKQPSWSGNAAGKSTKLGSTYDKPVKTWAP